ncbi:flippase [Acetivibrio sp. MSJd-27]|uniref:flippase n=1 Tax=Acetivibrio sp. MSJd-27 TaxID=2841523 RepID=UPI001C0F8F4C|nr:flippase [Acetivibrio sp. MSJd-27]MBU5450125.1 flippase [Acetivibrio sp. MSJd-27]
MSTEKKLLKNASWNIIYNLLNIVFSLCSAIYVSRILNPSGVGLITFVNTIAAYFIPFASLGMPTYGIREVARSYDSPNKNKVFTELFFINFCSSMIVSILYYLIVMSASYFRENRLLFFIAGFSILINAFNIEWFYKGTERFKFITTRNILFKIISLISIFLCVNSRSDIIVYMIITCCVSAGNQIVNLIHSKKYVQFHIKLISLKSMLRHMKPLLFLLVSIIAGELYSKIDIVMLREMCGDSYVGYYSEATRISNIVLTVIVSITAVMLPQLSQTYENRKLKEFNRLINNGLNVLLSVSLAAFVGIQFVGEDVVILLFGKAFAPAGLTLRILSFLFIVKGVGDLLAYQVVISIGRESIFPIIRFVAAALNCILNYILIKLYQQNGAAFASVVTELLTVIVVLIIVRKEIRIKMKKNNIISLFWSTFFMTVFLLLNALIPYNAIIKLIINIVFGAFIFMGGLMIFHNDIINLVALVKNKNVS